MQPNNTHNTSFFTPITSNSLLLQSKMATEVFHTVSDFFSNQSVYISQELQKV